MSGQVSLRSEKVETMCDDQFGIFQVELIALVGACLDVFWFDPPPKNDPHYSAIWRTWFPARLLGKISSHRWRKGGLWTNEYLAIDDLHQLDILGA